jgi:hypothetical protein
MAGRDLTRAVATKGQSKSRTAEPATAEAAPLPETVEELQGDLLEARAEAASWKRAYEQNRNILHQD